MRPRTADGDDQELQLLNDGVVVGTASNDEVVSLPSDEFDFTSDEEDNGEDDDAKERSILSKPFDMMLLRTSIERGSRALEEVEGRNVVLVVGKTGTGKSTLIQGIAGKKLGPATYETIYAGHSVTKQVFEVQDGQDLLDFQIGHAKTSKTKAIHCYSRSTSSASNSSSTDTSLLYLDSPGFEDTDGHEKDIATSVMISHVANKCRSMRFVILINYASLLEDRGGAMCPVLKFTRAFVRDFDQKNRSFMFLFTHTNEISDIPDDDTKGAKECLLREIIRTMDGTKDDDVKVVLEFMRKSLQKNFPFVVILHPLKTDFAALAIFIETKLAPVKELTLTGNCGLTLPSQLKLVGEVQFLLDTLHMTLLKVPADTTKVKNILRTFHYLGKHIEFGDVQTAVDDSKELFDQHIQ